MITGDTQRTVCTPHLVRLNVIVVHHGVANLALRVGSVENVLTFLLVERK